MNLSNEPIDQQDDIMINIQLFDSCFEINQELIPVVQQAAHTFGFSDVKDLMNIREEMFFAVFTPMMNNHYGLL